LKRRKNAELAHLTLSTKRTKNNNRSIAMYPELSRDTSRPSTGLRAALFKYGEAQVYSGQLYMQVHIHHYGTFKNVI